MTISPTPGDRVSRSSSIKMLPQHERYSTVPLPVPLTPFVARNREVATAISLLRNEHVRLLTLTGPGGVGKTRLALHVANCIQNDFRDGVYFISLASIRDPSLVIPTIAHIHGNRETGGVSITEILLSYLRSRHELLVIDNFEQVVDAAPLLADLLTSCPGITILVTSQMALHIQGEQELAIRPMEVPSHEPGTTWQTPPPADLANYEAIELFVQRARSVRPDFELNDDNALAVVEICRRLDGLPLAIELAAARIKLLSPSALLSRLATSLQVLTSGSRDLPERLRTMRSAITWSYDLLDAQEQRLMRWLAVFSSGFTFEAAEYLVNLQESEMDLFEIIASLVDKSLLIPRPALYGEPRFIMLETIREFALELLAEHGELETLQSSHVHWCLDLTTQARAKLTGPEAVTWMDRLELENNNIRSAIEWTLLSGNVEIAMRIAVNIVPFWFQRDYFTEGSMWLERAIELRPAEPAPLVANTLALAGLFAHLAGNTDLARKRLEESLIIATELGDTRSIAMATLGLADLIEELKQYEKSHALAEEAVAHLRQIDEPVWLALALSLRSRQVYRRGEIELTEQIMAESLHLARQISFGWGIAISLSNFGRFARDTGDATLALERFQEGIIVCQECGNSWLIIRLLIYIADIAVECGQFVRAAQLLGAAETFNLQLSGAFNTRTETVHASTIEQVCAALTPDAFTDAWNAGRLMTREEAVALALEISVVSVTEPLPASPTASTGPKLTPREIEVLQSLSAGCSDREIADALFISPRTVQSHVNSIFTKLDVNSRTAAATVALRLNLVEDPATAT